MSQGRGRAGSRGFQECKPLLCVHWLQCILGSTVQTAPAVTKMCKLLKGKERLKNKLVCVCVCDKEVRLFGRLVATEVRDSFLQLLLPTPELPFLRSHLLFSPHQSLQVL